MREPSGAEPKQSPEAQGESSSSSSWERGGHPSSGAKSEVSEPSGADAELKAESGETKIESETETKVEKE